MPRKKKPYLAMPITWDVHESERGKVIDGRVGKTSKGSPTRKSTRLLEKAAETSKDPETAEGAGKDILSEPKWEVIEETKSLRGGVTLEQRFIREKSTKKKLGCCAERTNFSAHHFFPGQIIRASSTVYHTNIDTSFCDDRIGLLREGPVFSKRRPMIVLWKTRKGLYCISTTSLKFEEDKMASEEWCDYISLTEKGDNWESKAHWAGKPLHYELTDLGKKHFQKRCYAQISRPVYVSRDEYIERDYGFLPGDQYARLINLFDYRQKEAKEKAFEEYGELYKPIASITHWNNAGGAHSTDEVTSLEQASRMERKLPVELGEDGEQGIILREQGAMER